MTRRFLPPLLATAALALACGDPHAPEESLRVEARILRQTVAPGDSAAVRVVAINPTSRAITVTSPTSCHFYIYIYDGSNEEVSHSYPSCLQAFTELSVAARDSSATTLYWDARVLGDEALVPAPPGVYKVRAVLELAGRSDRWSASVPLYIR